jgi:hypothetical protein
MRPELAPNGVDECDRIGPVLRRAPLARGRCAA